MSGAGKGKAMNKFIESINAGKIIMAAHRGDKKRRPENTEPAFRHAIEVGADCIETDLHQTKDGEIVVIHDAGLKRTTDGTGYVYEKTLAQIKELDAGSWFSPEYAGTRVPTFEEFLDIVGPYPDMMLNLELKDYPRDVGDMTYDTADKVIAAVERRGMSDRVMINSFSWQVLKYVHEKYGDKYPLHGFHPAFLMQSPEEDLFPYLTYVCLFNCVKRPDGSVDWSPDKTPEQRRQDFLEVKNVLHCEPCVCFGTDTPELMKTAVDNGVTMFTCNDPESAAEILRGLGLRK